MPLIPWSPALLPLPLMLSLKHLSRRVGGWLWRAAFWSIAGLAALVLVAWLIVQWGILPRLNDWRPSLERWASRSLGVQVVLGELQVSGDAWAPVVTLNDLRLVDARGREALRLARVEAVITPGSLLPRSPTHWTPRLQRLVLEALHLDMHRDRRGQVFLAGLPLERTDLADEDGRVADWLFSQPEVRLRGASLSWHDEQRAAEPLVLTGVDIDLRNPMGRHLLRLSATPPDGWGTRFQASAEMASPTPALLSMAGLRHPGDWRQWAGAVEADWPLVDVSRLRRHVDLPFDLLEGRGRLATRIELAQGRLGGASADLQLEAVTLRLAPALPPVALRRIAGRLEVRHDERGSLIRARQLSFQSHPNAPDPSLWPATDLELTLKGAPGEWHGGVFKASLVDLGLLAQSAAHVPLAGPMRRLLEATRPRGQVRQFSYEWSGDPEQPDHWRARGEAEALSLAAAPATAALTATATPGRPGLHGGRVRFDASDRGGQADLQMARGELDFPGVFEQPRVALERLQAEVRWTLRRPATARPGTRPAIEVEVRRAVFETADGTGEFSGRWRSGDPAGPTFERHGWLPGEIDLDATVHQVRADRLHRYLPLGIAESVRHYLRAALQQGTARDVRARVRGPVLDFPYAEAGRGTFSLDGRFEQLTFDSVPGSPWPRYTDGEGRLVIDGQRLQLLQTRARLGQTGGGRLVLEDIEGRIDDLVHTPVLHLSGHAHGPVADALQFLRDSPLDGWLDHAFASARGDGQGRLALQVAVPLLQAEHTTVQGRADLSGTTLQMRPDTPVLDELQARLDFTERQFALSGGQARAAGGPLQFEGRLDDDRVLRFSGHGQATAEGLRGLTMLGPVPRIARPFDGQAAYRLQLALTPGGPTVEVDSDLVGLASRLPAPLGKPASQPLALRVRWQPQGTATGLLVEAGPPAHPLLSTRLLLEDTPQGPAPRGQVKLGTSTGNGAERDPLPTTGLVAQVVLPRLSIDDWRTWWHAQQALATPTADASLPDEALASALRQVHLRVGHLALGGRQLTGVEALLQQTSTPAGTWHGTVEAEQLAGQLTLRPGSLQVRLGRLRLPWPTSPVSAPPAGLTSHAGPSPDEPLPALDVVVEELEVAGHPLGRLELQGAPSPEPRLPATAAAEWRLHHLSLTRPEARLSAVGRWSPTDRGAPTGPGTSRLTFRLDVHDGGQWLDRLGWPGTLRGGHGQLGGQLQWPGHPTALALAQLDGTLQLSLDSGQLLRADPGMGRLLGVLNLQSLPRRLNLDFRDVFQQGFSFDHLDGEVQIRRGLAHTRNLRLRGVQAMVLAEGTASLTDATQDLQVWIVPDLNAGAASLAYAVINPAVGLGTLVTQWLLQRPLAEAATREYRVTGPWRTPQVVAVERERETPSAPSTPRKDTTP